MDNNTEIKFTNEGLDQIEAFCRAYKIRMRLFADFIAVSRDDLCNTSAGGEQEAYDRFRIKIASLLNETPSGLTPIWTSRDDNWMFMGVLKKYKKPRIYPGKRS